MGTRTLAWLGSAVLVGALEFGGVPIPGGPLLVALAATESDPIRTLLMVAAATLGALTADAFWFAVGRRRGDALVQAYCRVTLGSRECAATTVRFFRRLGPRALVIGKFVPGLSAFGAPFAGMSGLSWSRFLGWDFFGSFLWAATWTAAGRVLGRPLVTQLTAHASSAQVAIVVLAAVPTAAILLGRLWRKHRYGPSTPRDLQADAPAIPTTVDA